MKKIILAFLSMALIYVTYAGTTISSQKSTAPKFPISSTGEPFTEKAPEKYSLKGAGKVYAQTNADALNAAKKAATALVQFAHTEHQRFGGDAPRV